MCPARCIIDTGRALHCHRAPQHSCGLLSMCPARRIIDTGRALKKAVTLSYHSSHFTDYIQPSAQCVPLLDSYLIQVSGSRLVASCLMLHLNRQFSMTGCRSQWWVRTGFAPVSFLISEENIRRQYSIP